MKRIIILLIAVILCLPLAACSKVPGAEQGPQENYTEATNTECSEDMQQSTELVGLWHLDRREWR